MRMAPSYRWVIVGAGALMTCVAIGAMFSLAVFLEPMSTETGWSRVGISSAMTLNFLIMGAGVTLAQTSAAAVDAAAKSGTLTDGSKLSWDRLVMAPGIDFRWGALP